MANQRTTFGKRQREQNRKDKARAKQERLSVRRASPTDQKGPPIAWAEAVRADDSADVSADVTSDPSMTTPQTDDPQSDGSSDG